MTQLKSPADQEILTLHVCVEQALSDVNCLESGLIEHYAALKAGSGWFARRRIDRDCRQTLSLWAGIKADLLLSVTRLFTLSSRHGKTLTPADRRERAQNLVQNLELCQIKLMGAVPEMDERQSLLVQIQNLAALVDEAALPAS